MKKICILIILALLSLSLNCGGGGGGSSKNSSGTSKITINLGQTRTASVNDKQSSQSSTIPPYLDSIRFSITGPGMKSIDKTILLSGRTTISETFLVPNGPNRNFLVRGLDKDRIEVLRGEKFVPKVDGKPLFLTIVMVSTDPVPPSFAGLSSIGDVTTTSMVISWEPATDNVTPQDRIQYLIFLTKKSETLAQLDLDDPTFTTEPGATSYTITELDPDTLYCVLVRAMDERGNRDPNTNEMCHRTERAPDTEPPAFGGLVSATSVSTSQINLVWDPASDDETDPSNIVYNIYMATTPGGQNFTTPTSSVTGTSSAPIMGLSPSTQYCFVVRSSDEAGNEDTNTIEHCATTFAPPDTEPPSFGGLVSATSVSTSQINLVWDPASDNVTPQGSIVYHIYMSMTSGGQNFASPTYTTSPGATSYPVTGLSLNTTYYFVVRSMDTSGNIDINWVERSATTFGLPDTEPPTFGGLVSATSVSTSQINLAWNPASDNITPQANIVYNIYMATTPGGQNFTTPTSSVTGTSSAPIMGLSPSTQYCFVVRSNDQAGNEDSNTIEHCATTFALPDTEPPTFGGLVSATSVSTSQINLAWNPASDNITPQANIVYNIYMATTPGGQNFTTPTSSVTGTTSAPIMGLSPSTQHCFVVRSSDQVDNEDTNTIEHCAITFASPGSDTTPPVFGGLLFASPLSSSVVSLSWNPATDDISPPSKIAYHVYIATTSGGQNFTTPALTTSQGATNTYMAGLDPCTTYYFVVRSRDQAGNIDGNVVEQFATTTGCTDLSIVSVDLSTTITVTLGNNGNTDQSGVHVCYISTDGSFPFVEESFVTIPAYSTQNIYPDSTWTDIYIYIDPYDIIAESNESNNTYCNGDYCSSPPSVTLCIAGS